MTYSVPWLTGQIVLNILFLIAVIVYCFLLITKKVKMRLYGVQIVIAFPVAFLICLIIYMLYSSTGGTKIAIEPGKFSITSPLAHPVVSKASIKTAAIKDSSSLGEYAPVKRIKGAELKDIKTGWWQLKNGKKAFAVISTGKVLIVETKSGDVYLLGPKDFPAFEKDFEANLIPIR